MGSQNPQWEKTIEIRKTAPKCELPIDVYIYCTKGKEGLWYVKNKTNANGHAYIGKNVEPILNGKVVAKFTLDRIETIERGQDLNGEKYTIFDKSKEELAELLKKSCLSFDQFVAYCDKTKAYFWHIDSLKVFDRPMELSKFKPPLRIKTLPNGIKVAQLPIDLFGGMLPPQSWRYIEGE